MHDEAPSGNQPGVTLSSLFSLVFIEAALATALAGTIAPPGAPCADCVTWVASPEQARRLLELGEPLSGLELLLRAGAPAALARDLAQRGARVGVSVPFTGDAVAGEHVQASTMLIDLGGVRDAPADDLAFRLKKLATDLRALNLAAAIGLDGDAETLQGLWERGLGAYVDFVVLPAADGSALEEALGRWPGTVLWRRVDSGSGTSVERLLAATAAAPGARWLVDLPEPGGAELALALNRLRDLLASGLTRLPDLTVSCAACESDVFLHPRTLDAIAVVRPRGPDREVAIRPAAGQVEVYGLGDGRGVALGLRRTPAGVETELPARGEAFALRIAGWSGLGEERFASDVEVVAERPLSVDEVISRHQAAAARQARAVASLVSSGTTVLTFQVPGLAAPVTIASDTVVYTAGGVTEIEQRSLRLNGLALNTRAGVPRLPIVEPERVTTPPLAIALTEAYRYRLEGRQREGPSDCYVVGFEPRDGRGPSFQGRAWIDAASFALVRMQATQRGLRGPIVSSWQEDEFAPVPVGALTVWLLTTSEIHQLYEGAGHRTPVHRVLTLDRHEANPVDFASRLAAARASSSVMLRDRPDGFRYLRRAGKDAGPGEAQRVLAGKAERVKTLAFGVLVDPNITRPLPFAGVSYVDVDFLNTGTQLNAFLAGAFAQAAWMAPSLGGSAWQLHGSAFASLVEYNDRSFREGIERFDENLRQRPARLSLGVARPLLARTRLHASYELGYTRLGRGDSTAPDFLAPRSPLVHGLRLALESQKGPWTATAWWMAARRQRWAAWGRTESPDFDPEAVDFQRYGASLARTLVFSPRAVARLETAWMAGRDLDRFSRFGFDGFENRLRGYPSASIRYDRGALARGAATWDLGRGLRLDAFLDAAVVRDPGFGRDAKVYPGIGAGLQAPLPFGALLSVEWGYGFEARGRDGERGTHVLRATGYRIF